MTRCRHYCRLIAFAALLFMPGTGFAQAPTASAPPPAKSTVKADMVPSLFVMNARGASLQGQTLTLTGISSAVDPLDHRHCRGEAGIEELLDCEQPVRGFHAFSMVLRPIHKIHYAKSCHTGEGRCLWRKWVPAFPTELIRGLKAHGKTRRAMPQ